MTVSNDVPAPMAAASSPAGPPTAGDANPMPPAPKKLHGRAFYESIGSPKFVLAPMVDQSEFVGSKLVQPSDTPINQRPDLATALSFIHDSLIKQATSSIHAYAPCPHVQRDSKIPRRAFPASSIVPLHLVFRPPYTPLLLPLPRWQPLHRSTTFRSVLRQ